MTTKNDFMDFLGSDKTQFTTVFDRYGRQDTLTIVKYQHNENNVFLYTRFNYENDFELNKKLNYSGFYNLKSGVFYDLRNEMHEFLKIDYLACKYFEELKNNVNSAIIKKAEKIINNDVKNIDIKKAKSQLSDDDKRCLKDYAEFYVKREAEDYFFKSTKAENIKVKIPIIEKTSIVDIINFIDNSELFAETTATEHIEKNLKKILKKST